MRYNLFKSLSLPLILLASSLHFSPSVKAQTEQAKSVRDFLDSLGVNVHIEKRSTPYYVEFSSILKPRLIELGIHHIRDSIWYSDIPKDSLVRNRFLELSQFGIRADIIIDTKQKIFPKDIEIILKNYSDSIELIEGPNEWDLSLKKPSTYYNNLQFPNNLIQIQRDIYKTVVGKLPVLAPSIVRKHSAKLVGLVPCDFANIHTYVASTHPGHPMLDTEAIPHAFINCPKKPVIVTEAGWHTAINAPNPGIPEDVHAKYIPRVFLEHFNRGIKRTYIYEFIDQRVNPLDKEANFGLLRYDGSPKPAFIALKNLISLLNDSRISFTPTSLDYTISGNTDNIHHTLLQKNNGDFFLIMWQEVQSYDRHKKIYLNIPDKPIQVILKTPIKLAVTYLPNNSFFPPQPVRAWNNPSTLSLKISDQIQVIKLIQK